MFFLPCLIMLKPLARLRCMPLEGWKHSGGSDIMIPTSAAFLRGSRIKSKHSWIIRFSRTPHIFWSLWINFEIGRSASRRKVWFVAFMQKSRRIFARLIRSGWAWRPPVIADILVLSDDRITPSRVAPLGNWLYRSIRPGIERRWSNKETYLYWPCSITTQPLCVGTHHLRCWFKNMKWFKSDVVLHKGAIEDWLYAFKWIAIK